MVMDARTSEVAGFLLLIEQEMRTQGLVPRTRSACSAASIAR